MPTVSSNNKKWIPPWTDHPHLPYSPRAPLKQMKTSPLLCSVLGEKPNKKNSEKYITRFLGSLISNPRYVDLHHIRFKFIWRSNCKISDNKLPKYTYIGFWGRWFPIRGPLTSILSDSKSFEGQNEENSLGSIFFQLYRGSNSFELALSWS